MPVSRKVATRAPTRIDLGGGWTDVPPYCDREGGFVCNVAISRYATATLAATTSPVASDGEHDSLLLRSVLRRSALSNVCLSLHNDFPMGAGLGGSSAATAAMLTAVAEWKGEPWDRCAVAEAGRQIEVEDLGIAGGRQDHYAATFGGALALTFTTRVTVHRIPLSARTCDDFISRSLLVYTGQSRVSGETVTAVLGSYEKGERRVVQSLRRMRELAEQMATALERADLDAVAGLMDEHWQFQRTLHPAIPTPLIDDIIDRARSAGALGGKAMGASGGGCVLVMARPDTADRVRQAIASLGTILEFQVDSQGVAVTASDGA